MDLMEEIFKRLESLHPKIIDLKLDRVKRLLRKYVDDVTLGELISILKICDAGKYSPTYKEEMDTIIPKTKNILKKIDKIFK